MISPKQPWSFYHDPSILQAESCVPLLLAVRKRVNELLGLWPSNPILEEINLIIDRVLSFDVRSPVVKFLAGLELLLTKCQVWEEKAHSRISVQPQMKMLSEKIVELRKLELRLGGETFFDIRIVLLF